jgi:TolA-binding protein
MIEREIVAAEKRSQEANKHFHRIKAVHDQVQADQRNAEISLQSALNNLPKVRAGVLLGNSTQKELDALRKKIERLRHDVDELPGAIAILAAEMEKTRKESARAQQELERLEAVRDYPKLRDEIVAAGKSTLETQRALGKLNALAVKIGQGLTEEVRRLSAELHEHAHGRRFKEQFSFTPDP